MLENRNLIGYYILPEVYEKEVTKQEIKMDVFAGRFRSRQRRTMGKKSENGRCKLTKNRNTVKFKFMLEKTQKATWCRSHD